MTKIKKYKTTAFIIASLILFSNNTYATERSNTINNEINSIQTKDSSASGAKSKKTHDGKTYENQATAGYVSNQKRAYGSNLIRSLSGAVPSGYMGSHVNLYNNSDRVVSTSDWYYNNGSMVGFSRMANYTTTSGSYYTKSTNHLYTRATGKYVPFSAIPSPKVSAAKRNIDIPKEELEERQQLYENKNMIAAVGLNNVEGYIKIDDLYGEIPNNPEDAIRLQNKRSKSFSQYRLIPLYKNDSKTIIGQYKIDFNLDNIEIIE